MDSAEQAALTPQADNGQPFKYYNAKKLNVFDPDGRSTPGTREMLLTPNTHFDHLPVNISLSSVLIPPSIDEVGAFIENLTQNSSSFFILTYFRFKSIKFDPLVRAFRSIICKQLRRRSVVIVAILRELKRISKKISRYLKTNLL